MEVDEVKILIDQLIHAFNTRDFESFFAYYTEDFDAFVGIQTPFLLEGKAAWKTFIEGQAAFRGCDWPNHALEPTPYSVRSCVAAAIGGA